MGVVAVRNFSSTGYQSILAQTSDEVWLVLLTIDHESLENPFRVVNNNEDIVSRSETFVRYPFDITLAEDTLESQPSVQVTFDNVDRLLTDTLRSLSGPATFTVEIIRASEPDLVEMAVNDLIMRAADWDASSISITLEVEDVFSAAFPSASPTFNPKQFPGLF